MRERLKDQRGSVTVISLIMLVFLLIAGVAWLPMMTAEKTASAMDSKEQQAWYSAEAGYKRAVAQLAVQNNDWSWLSSPESLAGQERASFKPNKISMDNGQVTDEGNWYAVSIVDEAGNDVHAGTNVDLSKCKITAIGSSRGVRKVITQGFIAPVVDVPDAGDKEEQPPEEVYINDSYITSSGYLVVTGTEISNDAKVYYHGGYLDTQNKGNLNLNQSSPQRLKLKYASDPSVYLPQTYKITLNGGTLKMDSGGAEKTIAGDYWYNSGSISSTTLKATDDTTLLFNSGKTGELRLKNVVIDVPKGKIVKFIVNTNLDSANDRGARKLIVENVKIKGGGQVNFMVRGTMYVVGLETLEKSRVLMIAGWQVTVVNPMINADDQAEGGAFLSGGNIDMGISDTKRIYTWYGQIQATGLVSINGRFVNGVYHLKLLFRKTGEKIRFPKMGYPEVLT